MVKNMNHKENALVDIIKNTIDTGELERSMANFAKPINRDMENLP